MKASHWCATFVAGLAYGYCALAAAQNQFPPATGRLGNGPVPLGRPVPAAAPAAAPSGAPHGTNVAVIDIKFIFDNHIRFKSAMESIKKESDDFEAQVRETETSLRKQIEQLKGMQTGSPEFKQLETQVATTRTQVQLDINRKQKDRVDEEAQVYHRAYKEVEDEIAKFSARNGIDLVLQFSSAEIDPTKPDTVIRGLNRLVVFQNGLDITKFILQELNRGAPVPQAPVAQPGRPAASPQRIGSPVGSPGFPKTR